MRVVALLDGARLTVINGEWDVSGSGDAAERLRDVGERIEEVLESFGPADGGPAHLVAAWLRDQGLEVTSVRERRLPRRAIP